MEEKLELEKKPKMVLGSRICPRCGGKKSEGGRRCRKCLSKNKNGSLTNTKSRRKDFRTYLVGF